MPRYRDKLPQMEGHRFLTDGGLETTLVFQDGIELPGFAAFVMLETDEKRERLRQYYRDYLDLAAQHGVGFVLESVSWRANRDWGQRIGYTPEQLADITRRSVTFLEELRAEYDGRVPHLVISGCVGPRGDGYSSQVAMSTDEAAAYHREQIATLRDTEADLVSALTLAYANEGAGIAKAARSEGMPVVISFTVETDGKLPSGETLQGAVAAVDTASDGWPAYYMINCAHPTHFEAVLNGESWARRIRAIRANASTKSHEELDNSTMLDAGDPCDLGSRFGDLAGRLPHLNVFGGCCGTDIRHVTEIGKAVMHRTGAPL